MTTPQPKITKVILYARSATGEDDALNRQLAAGRAWVEAQGGITLETHTEIASGNGACPELERAIQAAQAQGAALVCEHQDRLSRSLSVCLLRLDDCQQRGVPVFFASEPTPTEAAQDLANLKEWWEMWLGAPLRSTLQWSHPAPKTAWIYIRMKAAQLPEAWGTKEPTAGVRNTLRRARVAGGRRVNRHRPF